MRVVVTGAHGQLARSLVERAEHQQALEIIPLARPDLDLEIPGSARASIAKARPDLVINAAAYTAVDQAEDEPQRVFRINADGAGEVAEAATQLGVPLIQISTDYVFDGRNSSPYDENAVPNPIGVYGASKLAGEKRVRAANPRHAIVRVAWVYSPFGRNFVKSIMTAAATRDRLTVVDDQRGSPTSALDLADALIAMVVANCGWGETYHLVSRGTASWCEFAREIMVQRKALGLSHISVDPIQTEDWPTRAERPRNSALDSGKFERTFGFSMPDWRLSLAEVVGRLAQN